MFNSFAREKGWQKYHSWLVRNCSSIKSYNQRSKPTSTNGFPVWVVVLTFPVGQKIDSPSFASFFPRCLTLPGGRHVRVWPQFSAPQSRCGGPSQIATPGVTPACVWFVCSSGRRQHQGGCNLKVRYEPVRLGGACGTRSEFKIVGVFAFPMDWGGLDLILPESDGVTCSGKTIVPIA